MKYIRNRAFFLSDMLLLALASYTSYVLRLEGFDLNGEWSGFALFTILGVCVTPLVFWKTGVYSRYWRYASIEELLLLTGAVTISAGLIATISLLVMWLLPGVATLHLSVPLIFLMLALGATYTTYNAKSKGECFNLWMMDALQSILLNQQAIRLLPYGFRVYHRL